MNSQKKKLLKEVESRKQIGENKPIIQNENKIPLANIELRTRKIADELNNIVALLCQNVDALSKENEELKKQLKGKTDAPTE